MAAENNATIDPQVPAALAVRAEEIGAQKAGLDTISLLALSVLAGAFIAFGAMLSTVAATGAAGVLPYGVARLIAGAVFSLGLILVVAGGAELFTGNNLMVMAWASRRITTGRLLRAWAIVYAGNLVGGLGTAALVFLSGQHGFAGGAVGATALGIATAKVALPPFQALMLGILCNVLVCLAVWLCLGARTIADRVLAIVPPVTAFVAAGFEHSIANMYFVPLGMMIRSGASDGFWTAIGRSPDEFATLTLAGFLANLAPVTIGNVIGGAGLVGAVYWFIYLRGRRRQ
ncbi:MAG: formate transporter FocA [Rhodospirillaceae bacterium]